MPFVDLRIDSDDVLQNLSVRDVIEYFGEDDLLGEIGEEAAIKYFGIEVNDGR